MQVSAPVVFGGIAAIFLYRKLGQTLRHYRTCKELRVMQRHRNPYSQSSAIGTNTVGIRNIKRMRGYYGFTKYHILMQDYTTTEIYGDDALQAFVHDAIFIK